MHTVMVHVFMYGGGGKLFIAGKATTHGQINVGAVCSKQGQLAVM